MYQGKRIIALIPLRGGSKSIPYKNIKEIAGRPLAYWVLKAAKESKYVDEVHVSTEDEKIKDVILSLGMDIKIIDRPAEFATDSASTESVMLHFFDKVSDFDSLILLQATSPLTTDENIDQAIEQYFNDGCDSLLSGVVMKKFFWTEDGKPLNYDPMQRPRRQDFAGILNENGAFYITKKTILEEYKNRLGGKIGVFVLPEYMVTDIDEPADWPIVEKLLLEYKKNI